jgi:uncharacterized Zn finger protein (UPF0148 family)
MNELSQCPHCGNPVNEKETYCSVCGKKLYPAAQSENEAAGLESPEHDPDDELRQFVSENWDYYDKKWRKMNGRKNLVSFNFAAFFLTFFWLGYRKMYKAVFIIAGFFLLSDIFLYLIGYQYDFNSFIDPVDRIIGMAVYITLGLYGNYFYKKHAEKQMYLINQTDADNREKEMSFQKKGGRGWLGVLLAVLIMACVYFIPAWFIPMNYNDADIVKSTEFYDYPDVTLEKMFDSLFDDGAWEHTASDGAFEIVAFSGKKQLDGKQHQIEIQFALDEETYETEVISISLDKDELDAYEKNLFMDDLFTEYDRQQE